MNVLNIIIEVLSKEIKEENDNIRQVILAFLSAWTHDPQNLRILAPSGEGKTYLLTKISEIFPQENIIILAKATPQSFKYHITKKVILANGKYEDWDSIIQPIEDELSKTEDKQKRKELQKKIKDLAESTYDLVDFTGKVLVFVDSQSFQLWESLKPILSHDQKILKSFSVNKSKSGTIQAQKIIFSGHPAVIYCSAKDEHSQDTTDEISTRFNTISLNASQIKYREMLKLQAVKLGVPKSMNQNNIIDDSEITKARQIIEGIVGNIQKFDGEIINPFHEWIQEKFPSDAGFRTRQLGIFLKNMNLHTLSNAKYRPKFTYKEQIFPFACIDDLIESNRLSKKPSIIPPAKILFFNKNIRHAILQVGKEKNTILGNNRKFLTATEIVDWIRNKGIITDRKKLHENHLRALCDCGYLEEYQDPDNRNRNIYCLSTQYTNEEAGIESTLIDRIDVEESCVKSFLSEFIQCRLEEGKLQDQDENEISVDQLLDIILNRRLMPEITHKNTNVDTSIDVGARS